MPTEDMSPVELELAELFDLLNAVKRSVRQLKAVTDEILVKSQISHSLLVVRKVDEGNLEKLGKLLD